MVQSPPSRQRTKSQRRHRPGLILTLITLAYGLVLLAVSAINVAGPERWWLGSLNLYMPQWPWALPSVVILPWTVARAPRWSWLPILLAAWAAGPIMGLSLGLARLAPKPAGLHLRVMTYNVKWGLRDAAGVLDNISRANPDVIVMQHSIGALDGPLAALKHDGWIVMRRRQCTVLSRYPISDVAPLMRSPERKYESIRCVLHVSGRPVVLYDVHLMTPRWALGSIADKGPDGATDLQENATVREQESDDLASHIRAERGPLIVAGDLNAPIQSRVCRTLFHCGLRDAYSEAGFGYGYTYGQSTVLRHPFVRIDHVLVSPEWTVSACHAGSARGSDHSPVVADVVLPNTQ
jgi:vancomycin resistance protein VanJ